MTANLSHECLTNVASPFHMSKKVIILTKYCSILRNCTRQTFVQPLEIYHIIRADGYLYKLGDKVRILFAKILFNICTLDFFHLPKSFRRTKIKVDKT